MSTGLVVVNIVLQIVVGILIIVLFSLIIYLKVKVDNVEEDTIATHKSLVSAISTDFSRLQNSVNQQSKLLQDDIIATNSNVASNKLQADNLITNVDNKVLNLQDSNVSLIRNLSTQCNAIMNDYNNKLYTLSNTMAVIDSTSRGNNIFLTRRLERVSEEVKGLYGSNDMLYVDMRNIGNRLDSYGVDFSNLKQEVQTDSEFNRSRFKHISKRLNVLQEQDSLLSAKMTSMNNELNYKITTQEEMLSLINNRLPGYDDMQNTLSKHSTTINNLANYSAEVNNTLKTQYDMINNTNRKIDSNHAFAVSNYDSLYNQYIMTNGIVSKMQDVDLVTLRDVNQSQDSNITNIYNTTTTNTNEINRINTILNSLVSQEAPRTLTTLASVTTTTQTPTTTTQTPTTTTTTTAPPASTTGVLTSPPPPIIQTIPPSIMTLTTVKPIINLDPTTISFESFPSVTKWDIFTQTNQTNRPSYSSSGGGIGGAKPYVSFSSSSAMVNTSGITLRSGTNGGCTVVMFVRFTGQGGNQQRCFQLEGAGSSNTNGYIAIDQQSPTSLTLYSATPPNYNYLWGAQFPSTILNTSEWAVRVVRFTNFSSTACKAEFMKFTKQVTSNPTLENAGYSSATLNTSINDSFFNQNMMGGASRPGYSTAQYHLHTFKVWDSSLPDAELVRVINQLIL